MKWLLLLLLLVACKDRQPLNANTQSPLDPNAPKRLGHTLMWGGEIFRFRDPEHRATCWMVGGSHGNSISCVRDP